ncbi:MAG: WYL domain-containing protein [Proteobacteria bacterium]|nr:WYL domain-containing protein [Pseudomonadota bacterium]MBU1419009.1 WYL domain-containing protein [Pseudomonadota bacterium]MBU1454143.1 WYL domain-containing protein [Pseudomonadota bacterium]
MSRLERIYAFHQKLKNNRYPNAQTLVQEFELSRATAHRDISYMRDRLLAPLAFDASRKGFYYTEDDFSLPFEDSPKLLFLMGLLNKMADEAGLGSLPEIKKLEKRLSGLIAPGYDQLMDNVLCQWIEVESLTPSIFETIVEAVVRNCFLEIAYRSVKGEKSIRSLEPQRLINYQGRWYLLAFCLLRQDHRLFHMARIETAAIGKKRTGKLHRAAESFLDESFGIFLGKVRYHAKIQFTGMAAELVRRQYWHGKQEIEELENGICLSLPVSDDREILMKILQYGANARVLAPESLRKRVTEEINNMTETYKH